MGSDTTSPAPAHATEWRCGRAVFRPGSPTVIMGVLNITPDSFSDGSCFLEPAAAVEHGLELVRQGADVIDVGGESTRPGADPVPAEVELGRVLPVIRELRRRCDVAISVDTVKAAVASEALREGADIINDISGGGDPGMIPLLAGSSCGYVLMHCRGTPKTMQQDPAYADVVSDVLAFLRDRVAVLAAAGVAPERVALDPGFGFGKNWKHNRDLLVGLSEFCALGRPVLAGLSRKSFIGRITGTGARDRVAGSLAAESLAVYLGATIIRTHEPGQARQAAAVAAAVRSGDAP